MVSRCGSILLIAMLALFCTALGLSGATGAQKEKGLEGIWQATIPAGNFEVHFLIEIKKTAEGNFTGVIDVPEQKIEGLALEDISFKDGLVQFQIKKSQFEGKMDPTGNIIAGKLKKADAGVALNFKRIDKKPSLVRPQEPKKPYPYNSEDVVYENAKAKIKFAGTLTWPKGKGPYPAVLLLSGSGPQDRDSTMLGHKPFLVLADYLTRKGIAVLRVDDRGVGGSGGSVFLATLEDEAADALAGIAFLKTRAEIDPKHIGLIGHSEGGTVAPIAASNSADVAFIVMMAGTGIPGDEVMFTQGQAILKAKGAPKEALDAQKDFQLNFFKIPKEETDPAKAMARLEKMLAERLEKLPEAAKKAVLAEQPALIAQLKSYLTPWFRSFLLHDPAPFLEKTDCPVLVLNGSLDTQVVPKENLAAIAKALKAGGNKDFTIKELPQLNHLFQTAKTGAPSEYAQIEETLAPVVLEMIADWIGKRTQR